MGVSEEEDISVVRGGAGSRPYTRPSGEYISIDIPIFPPSEVDPDLVGSDHLVPVYIEILRSPEGIIHFESSIHLHGRSSEIPRRVGDDEIRTGRDIDIWHSFVVLVGRIGCLESRSGYEKLLVGRYIVHFITGDTIDRIVSVRGEIIVGMCRPGTHGDLPGYGSEVRCRTRGSRDAREGDISGREDIPGSLIGWYT